MKKKKRKLSASHRDAIRRGVQRSNRRKAALARQKSEAMASYWRKIKRLASKHKITKERARKVVKAGGGKSKREIKRDRKKKKAKAAAKQTKAATLWEGREFLIAFEENVRDSIKGSIPATTKEYTASLYYEDEGTGEDDDVEYEDVITWTAAGESAFWSGWWSAMKAWINTMAGVFSGAFEIDKSPKRGSAVVTKVTYNSVKT